LEQPDTPGILKYGRKHEKKVTLMLDLFKNSKYKKALPSETLIIE
jgi:hypothetical protein